MTKLIVAFRNFVNDSYNPQDWKTGNPNLPNTKQDVTHLTALFGSILKLKNESRWTQRCEPGKGTDFCNIETLPL
jgi:hypothetical protein